MFTFEDLCSKPLSAADYLEICTHFDTIFVTNIPKLTSELRTEAKRFIIMIDTFYDHKMKLICTAEANVKELFQAKRQNVMDSMESRHLADDLIIDEVR